MSARLGTAVSLRHAMLVPWVVSGAVSSREQAVERMAHIPPESQISQRIRTVVAIRR